MIRVILFALGFITTVNGLEAPSAAETKPASGANRFTYLDSDNPFWPGVNSPKLVTPRWIGEEGVEAAVILAIDDMRADGLPKYEAFLRPILNELKRDGGRSPLSIMTCTVKPDDPQLQSWIKEGVSIEVHTLKHPCPLLQSATPGSAGTLPALQTAKDTVHGCIDLLNHIPNNKPVAFRTPCCDSMSTPSPRVFSEILAKTTPAENFLTIDSSVMTLITPNDKALPKDIVFDKDGHERFRKYFPSWSSTPHSAAETSTTVATPPKPALRSPHKSLANFGTYIEDYPYPYVIDRTLWEFPCMVPSDWEAFNTHGPNNPVTVEDWNAALDAVVLKQGVFTFIFHPHGWIKAEQIAEFIRHAREKYGKRVKFLNFGEAAEKLSRHVSGKQKLAASIPAKSFESPLPAGISLTDSNGRDNGVRFVDLNGDGHDDLVFSNAERYGVYLFNPVEKKNVDWQLGWTFVMREGKAGDANSIPPIVRADGTNNGVWFEHGSMWVQNEDTSALPDKVRRIPFSELMRQPGPAPRTPEESLKAIHIKPGFKVELVANEPLVQDPVWIDWGADGKMWVVEMADYPLGIDNKGKPGGRVKRLEDTNGDGVYDKATLFLDGLSYPNSLAPWKNGIFILSDGELLFAEDSDGDGRADKRTVLYTGFTKGNPQHLANGFAWGLDGWFYGGNGDSGGKIRSTGLWPAGRSGVPPESKEFDLSGRDFRFNPVTGEFQLQAGKTQYGRWRDDFGNWFGCNNSSMGWHYFMDERYLARNPKLAVPALRRMLNNEPDNKRIFPVSAPIRRYNWPDAVNTLTSGCNAIPYRDTLFGDAYAHSFFICEPANNLVHHEVLEPDGISFRSHRAADEKASEFLASEDNYSRFTMARTGPDGCLYVVDMYRLVIEHPEWIPKQMLDHIGLRDGEDKGRIYRIRPDGVEPRKMPRLDKATPLELGRMLKSANGWTRDVAQRLLIEQNQGGRDILTDTVKPAFEMAAPEKNTVQMFSTLQLLGSLTPTAVWGLMGDPHAQVREHAIRLAESFSLANGTVIERILALASDPDLRVRVQVALTLGESSDPRVPDVLRSLAKRDGENPDMLMALLTAYPKHQAALAEDAKRWQLALKNATKSNTTNAPVQIITNHNPDRDKVVKQYTPAVAGLKGDSARGHALYKNICAACHKLKNEGTEIGPDLGTIAGKPTEQIVEAIMDPSRAVEARYLAQTIKHRDGREIVAMIAEETANSLTLRTATGTEIVLKADIANRKTGTKSIMPEGVESLLTPQFVADVIAWIREK